MSYSGSANHSRSLADADVSYQLAQGEQNASLADYRTIREKEKLKLPRDITEVCITLTQYCVLCQTLFQGTGPANAFMEAMWRVTTTLQNAAPFNTERCHPATRLQVGAPVYYA